MGLVDETDFGSRLEPRGFVRAMRSVARAGIGRRAIEELEQVDFRRGEHVAPLLDQINTALFESPLPDREWKELETRLGLDTIASLLDVSASSARRYRRGLRATPDLVADRLHFLALVVGDLVGSYNDVGLRRWFERPRRLLDGKSPARILTGPWKPGDEAAERVRLLAQSLTASPAT
ncbi:MAG: hypothetical protein ACREQ9_00660 [Candidatus Binatia bacterium]